MSRSIQKLSFKYEYLKLELEELDEIVSHRTKIFNSTFGEYFIDKSNEYWINEETGEIRKEPPREEKSTKKKSSPKKLKDLYKKLSTYTHPDKGGSTGEFQEIKESYENNDFLGLLKFASKYKLDIVADDDDVDLVNKSIDLLKEKIQKHKNSLAYNFFSENKIKRMAVVKEIERIYQLNFTEEELNKFLEVKE